MTSTSMPREAIASVTRLARSCASRRPSGKSIGSVEEEEDKVTAVAGADTDVDVDVEVDVDVAVDVEDLKHVATFKK